MDPKSWKEVQEIIQLYNFAPNFRPAASISSSDPLQSLLKLPSGGGGPS